MKIIFYITQESTIYSLIYVVVRIYIYMEKFFRYFTCKGFENAVPIT